MTRTTTKLRAALQLLAEQAPSVEDLNHRAWSNAVDSAARLRRHRPRRDMPRRRTVCAVLASAALVVAVVEVLGAQTGSGPAAGGGVLEVRPLVAPAVVTRLGARSPDPLHALPFPVPRSETGYDRLSESQQQQLLSALATTDCSAQAASTARTRVACSATPGRRPTAYLLGPSIFGRDQLTQAQPIGPITPRSGGDWAVVLTLDARASTAWARFTTAHNTRGASSSHATHCASSGTPCADFVAFVVNGSAVSVPVTLAPIAGGQTQISGDLDRQAATTLAKQLRP